MDEATETLGTAAIEQAKGQKEASGEGRTPLTLANTCLQAQGCSQFRQTSA